jgi:signal peptidase I
MPDLLVADALRAGQLVRLRVATSSMVPTLYPGDLVEVEGTQPRVNDIAVLWTGSNWLVHRLLWLDGDHAVLCGDAAGHTPHTETAAAVHGRVHGVRRTWHTWLRLGRNRVAKLAVRFRTRLGL